VIVDAAAELLRLMILQHKTWQHRYNNVAPHAGSCVVLPCYEAGQHPALAASTVALCTACPSTCRNKGAFWPLHGMRNRQLFLKLFLAIWVVTLCARCHCLRCQQYASVYM
jgi:hypothetical protein